MNEVRYKRHSVITIIEICTKTERK